MSESKFQWDELAYDLTTGGLGPTRKPKFAASEYTANRHFQSQSDGSIWWGGAEDSRLVSANLYNKRLVPASPYNKRLARLGSGVFISLYSWGVQIEPLYNLKWGKTYLNISPFSRARLERLIAARGRVIECLNTVYIPLWPENRVRMWH